MQSILSMLTSNILNIVIGLLVLILILYGFKRIFYKKAEGFQDDATNAVSTGEHPVKLGKEHCRMLYTQLNQYKQVRKEHPDTLIVNLDETITQLTEYYNKYSCNEHTY
jgi:hypothetical protein